MLSIEAAQAFPYCEARFLDDKEWEKGFVKTGTDTEQD